MGAVRTGPTLVAGRPEVLFEVSIPAPLGARPYDVPRDGRFIVLTPEESEGAGQASGLTLVLNWVEALKRLVPRWQPRRRVCA